MGNQVFLRSDRTLRVVLHLDVIPQDIATVAIVVSRTNRAVLRLDRTNPFILRLDRTNRDAMKSAPEEVDLVVGRRVVSAARRVATTAAITAVSTITTAAQDSIISLVVSAARRLATVATTAVVSAARRLATVATTAVSTTISTITTAALDSVITVARKGALLEARRGDITASTTMKNAT